MKKNNRTKEQIFTLVTDFSSSGISVKEYANFHGMKYGTYKYWVRKYRAEQKQKPNKSASSSFIPVKIATEKVKEHSLDIVYPNGVQIEITNSLNTCGSITLKKLVSCLD